MSENQNANMKYVGVSNGRDKVGLHWGSRGDGSYGFYFSKVLNLDCAGVPLWLVGSSFCKVNFFPFWVLQFRNEILDTLSMIYDACNGR